MKVKIKKVKTFVEPSLEVSELRYRRLFETAQDGILILDAQTGAITDVNPYLIDMLGYSRDEFMDKKLWEVGAFKDIKASKDAFDALEHDKYIRYDDMPLKAKDGHLVQVEFVSNVYSVNSYNVIQCNIRDITERKRAEIALKEKVEDLRRLATVVSDSNDAVIMHDLDGKIMAWNRGAQETYGYTEAEALGKNVREIVAGPDREAALTLIQKIKQGEIVKSFELRRLAKDGRVLDVWLTTTLLRDVIGNPMAIATTERDITQRKRAQEEIRELNAGLERRVIERTTQLEAANKELESFAYSASHDLRAPLRSIDGFSQILLEDYADKLDAAGQDALKRVRAAAQRMAELIDDMLKLSRLTRSEMRLETVGLSAMAHAVLDELQRTQPGRQVDCVIAEGIVAKGDTQLLRAVLENLLGNAWKFTGKQKNARIEFGMFQRDGETAYFVRDNGAGFDMAFVNKLFGAFQRLHTAGEFPGTGIGLASVQRIIHRHSGRVWAEGALAQGATFYFTLPEEAI
jgi:PAS domain S-box-containing protein